MYIYVIFDPNQAEKPQGNKVVQYFEILNSVHWDISGLEIGKDKNKSFKVAKTTFDNRRKWNLPGTSL